ncbi:MAG: carbon-nitrogen hydrolase family protein [Planctomycetota bacterium]
MKIAVGQLAPVLLDREATVKKAADAVTEAARNGAAVVAFGETFIPAYPVWLARQNASRFEADDVKRVHAAYLEQAVDLAAGDLDVLCDAARTAGVHVVTGVAERAHDRGSHSIYCSAVTIGPDGSVLSAHRKLMPTYEERLSWAIGDGAGLVTHRVGEFTMGSLNCWENWMPLARASLHAQGEDLHVAIWPGCERLTSDITRFAAREGRSFVVSASGIIRASDVPASFPERASWVHDEDEAFYDGGSCVAGPDGRWVVEPVVGREEIVYADIDRARVLEERQNFDPSGHYARPEVLGLTVDRRRHSAATFIDGTPG